jgi:hypothetical protein
VHQEGKKMRLTALLSGVEKKRVEGSVVVDLTPLNMVTKDHYHHKVCFDYQHHLTITI